MKKVIKYAVLNDKQYNGSEGYNIHELSHEIICEDLYYTLGNYIFDHCDYNDIEELDNGDYMVGSDYYILLCERNVEFIVK